MNNHQRRATGSPADDRERNTVAVQTLLRTFGSPRLSEHVGHLMQDYGPALAAFLLSGVSRRAAGPYQLDQEFERHYVLTTLSWHDAAEQLLLPPTLANELEELQERLGEPFTRYLTMDEAGIRERLREKFVVVETEKELYIFTRPVSR